MSPDENEKWLTPRRMIWIGVAVVLLAGGAFAAKPAYREIKRWRAHGFVSEAEALIARNNWELALRKAQQALQLSNSDPRCLRLMARVLSQFNHEHALSYWKELMRTGKATAADRNQFITVALRQRDWNTARDQLLIALKENPVPETYRLTSDYYAAQGDFKQGVSFARQAVGAAPTDSANRFFLAHRLMSLRGTDETREAFTLLKQISTNHDAAALDAIALLAARFQPSLPEVDEYARLIAQHPARTLVHEFFALDMLLQFKPGERQQIIDSACAKYTALNDEALVQLGRWLNRNKEFALVTRHISLARALGSQELFLVYLDALAALTQWADVGKALESSRLPLDPFYTSIYQVRVAIELGQKELVPVNWSLAQRRAGDNAQYLLYLAQYAEKIGANDEAIKAYRRLTEISPNLKAAFVSLVRLLEPVGHTRDVREVLRLMMERFPEETAARNDYAYLTLLLNENVEATRQIAEQLFRANPNLLAHRATLALAYLRIQQPQNAKALLAGLNIKWSEVLPGWQCVYAATLASNGDVEGARQLARQIPTKNLKPEERFLIQGLL